MALTILKAYGSPVLEVLVATESLVAVLIVRNPFEVVAAVPMPTKPSLLT